MLNSSIFKINSFLLILTFVTTSCILDNSSEPPSVNFEEIAWEHTSIDSGVVNMVAANINGKVFSDGGVRGLYCSEDQGETWQLSAANYSISNMAFRPNGDIFALTSCSYATQILHSNNGGLSWQILPFVIDCPSSMAFHPSGSIFIGDLGDEDSQNGAIYI